MWIPVDVTVAEGAEWSYNATADERHRHQENFSGSLGPYRYIIQKSVDIPLTPDPGDAVVLTRNEVRVSSRPHSLYFGRNRKCRVLRSLRQN